MSHNKYITLTDSATITSKKFRVLWEGFEPSLEKSLTMNKTINGGIDISMGAIYEQHKAVVRVRHTESENGWGNLADLEWFYRLNDPTPTSGSPSNLITMTDHFNVSHTIYIIGSFPKRSMGIEIEGSDAWYAIPLIFQVVS